MKRVSAGMLKNGFRFYTQLDTRAHVSGIGVKVGSIHDPTGLVGGICHRGMCHLVEHVLGGYSRKDELKFEEYLCGPEENINIRVDHSSTFYGHGMLLRREYVLELFEIITRGLKEPVINQEALKRERAAVLNEYYLHGIDAMESHIHDLIHQAMYERNPAKNRIDCEPDELFQISVDDIRRFIASYYVPNNMFAVILGTPFRKVKRIAEELFGELPSRQIPQLAYDFSDTRPILTTPKIIEMERKGIHQYHVAVGFPTNPYGSKDDEALEVLSHIWRWRLREVLRGQNYEWGGGTYRALKFIPHSFVHGMIYITFATPSTDFARAGIDRIIAECDSLKTQKAPSDEFNAMWKKVYNNYVEDFEIAPEQLSERIIEAAANGDEDMHRLNSFLGRLSNVTRKRVMRAANEYFTTPNYVAIIIKPAPE